MYTNKQNIELPVNMEEKMLCLLLLDVSGSMGMGTPKPIDLLNTAINEFYNEIKNGDTYILNRLEIAVVKFDTTPKLLQKPVLIEEFDAMPPLFAEGVTCSCTCKALKFAIDIVKERKAYYRECAIPYFRPWIILMTNGYPTDEVGYPISQNDNEFIEISEIIKKGVSEKHYEVLGIGVGDANMEILSKMTGENALLLEGLNLSAFIHGHVRPMPTPIPEPGNIIDIPIGIDKFVEKMRILKI